MRDTSLAAERRYFELLREKSSIERLDIALGLTRLVRELALAAVTAEHPSAEPNELKALLAERPYGRTVADRVFRRA